MTAAEERSAIDRTLGGDVSAFEALVLDNQKNVYNLALRLTGDENDALDASQEAFLRAYTHLGSFKGESRFSVWLYRITYNVCSDFLRKRARDRSAQIISLDEYGDGRESDIPDVRALPEDALLRRELREAIRKGIDSLPPVYRETLLLRESSGMSYADIADVMCVGEGTVKSRLSRARQALVRVLTENGTLGGEDRLNIY
ncbi:MAG: sigma-70 family RNA polymerase sigma factor [Oscillospiraceae bacterium]|nr:sigma-70 family RNA polymerase sigma factor [Oscillospiraceae bacterium]